MPDQFLLALPLGEMLLRLAVASALGLAVGWERELHEKPAGMRTHALVALGAAAFMMIAIEIARGPMGSDVGALRIDPTRVIAGIIGGIGFLGAGSFIRSGDEVKGLTTGAGIWAVGAVGVAAGIGAYAIAVALAAFIFVLLWVMGAVERKLRLKTPPRPDA